MVDWPIYNVPAVTTTLIAVYAIGPSCVGGKRQPITTWGDDHHDDHRHPRFSNPPTAGQERPTLDPQRWRAVEPTRIRTAARISCIASAPTGALAMHENTEGENHQGNRGRPPGDG